MLWGRAGVHPPLPEQRRSTFALPENERDGAWVAYQKTGIASELSRTGGPCEGYTCEFGGVCVERYGQAECTCPECSGIYEPVCGDDKRTYHSLCLLARHVCLTHTQVEVLHEGSCDACKRLECGEYGVCEVDQEGRGRCSCPTNCSQALGGEVCGNDGKTYSSECHLRMTACSTQVQLRARHKGNCDLCLDVHCKYGARCEGGRCICPTDCPDKREPVCGSDRITYNNECVMRKVACEKNEDISYLFFGECDEIGGIVTDVIYPTPLPPTSPEDPCHAYKCIAGAQCKADASDGRPRCICDFYCSPPPRYEPVCGSDMEFYESECLMRLHACNIQVELFVLPVEKCAGEVAVLRLCSAQKTRACNGTSPLINPSTGEDLYCGEGGTICPPGTYCHRDQELAKCCRDFSVRIAVIEAPVPDDCDQSQWGCCEDGINFAKGPDREGCPEACRCHRLGAVRESCDAITGMCECRPGVGGNNCDRCLPGYYGLQRVSNGAIGCTPCGCSLFGSLRTDCKQMTGECVCKPGVSGHRCTQCPRGKVLRPEGCVYVPEATTCELLQCHFGGQCREEGGIATCQCTHHCLPGNMGIGLVVCGSDRVTYASECELKYQACVQQADIVVIAFGPCDGGVICDKTPNEYQNQIFPPPAPPPRFLPPESWTDAPVRRSTAEDGWGTEEWAWPGRGRTEHHGLATRRHIDASAFTRAHLANSAHSDNMIIESPPPGVTPITALDSEEQSLAQPLPQAPKQPYKVPAFSGTSYIQLMTWSVPTKVQIEVDFVAHELDGVIVYTQQDLGGLGDYLALVLINGYVEVRLDLGNGPIQLRSHVPVKPYTRTTASVRTYSRDALLQVGVGEAVSGRSAGVHRALDINAPLYVGGIPSIVSQIADNLGVGKGLTGCIYGLKIGRKALDLVWGRSPSVGHAYNVTECHPSPCAALPCLNGGTCHPRSHLAGFRCQCPPTYTGARCQVEVGEECRRLQCPPGTSCQHAPATATLHCAPDSGAEGDTWPVAEFTGEGYLALPRPESALDAFTLEVWFLSRALHGMLLYGGQGPTVRGHFVSLNLASGFLHFRFDVGSGVVNLTSNTVIEVGVWHRVVATWAGGRASLQLDQGTPITCPAPTPLTHNLAINMPIYLGGVK
ncbi:agrin-like [Penaeus indicus]|uniref:agrin-like n=1 Tax=Penaeus indicus TaxID=29960 RepID=UPI00300CB69D